MPDKPAIAFTITVTERDWDIELSGWRCPVLKIPGAKVESVFVSGSQADSSWYEVNYELHIIRWGHSERPLQATLQVKLTKELSTEELTLRWKKLAIVLPLVTSIVAILISSSISKYPQPNEIPKTANLTSTCDERVKMIVPTDNATVPVSVPVMGAYQNLPQGQKIYVVVYPTDIGRFYPQPSVVREQPDNTWSCDVLVGVDDKRDIGRIFFIYAVLANNEAQNELNMYINQIKSTNDSPGLKDLPKGAQICSSVRVKRK